MKNGLLLSAMFTSTVVATPTVEEVAVEYQTLLNNENIEQAIQYWEPQKAEQIKQDNGLALNQLLDKIVLIHETINSRCGNRSCKVFAKYTNGESEIRRVVYTFKNNVDFKLSNVQTLSL